MKKKHNITSRLLAACCLATLLAIGCTADDPFHSAPQGAIPLRLGSVSISGAETATRAAATRAEITTEDAQGYTGLRKTHFVDGDILTLTLTGSGTPAADGTPVTVTASRVSNTWQLNPEAGKVFILPSTGITATHAGVPSAAGTSDPDGLVATTYTLDGQSISLSMTHANALIDVTFANGALPAGTPAPTDLKIHFSTAAAGTTTTGSYAATPVTEADGEHHTTILTPDKSVTQISLKINGVTYIAPLDPALTLEANKRYPIALSFKQNRLTATVGTASLDWTSGGKAELVPPGYDRYIGTPEDLAQFAADMNACESESDPLLRINVLQTADIDLSQLLPLNEAQKKYPDKNYTYTATKDNWEPISGNWIYVTHRGIYNGNGYIISNMHISKISPLGLAGFYGSCRGGTKLIGVHLRDAVINVSINDEIARIGILCGDFEADGLAATLCSVTGNITTNGGLVGGIVGWLSGADVSRCSSDVTITAGTSSSVGGFAGIMNYSKVVGCSSIARITANNAKIVGGFCSTVSNAKILGCSAGGTIAGTATKQFSFLDEEGESMSVGSCYSSVITSSGFGASSNKITYTDCAYTGSQSTPIDGVTSDVAPDQLYNNLTKTPSVNIPGVKTLHWSKVEGYTTNVVTKDWYASEIWQDTGATPTMDLTYEGGGPLYNGKPSNLLAIDGYTPYWVAPENILTDVTWGEVSFDTVCPKGWHVPTKEEFTKMSPTLNLSSPNLDDMIAIVKLCFPMGDYCSSTAEGADRAFYYTVEPGYSMGIISSTKSMSANVRCVRNY